MFMKLLISIIFGALISFQVIRETPQHYFDQGMEHYQVRQLDSSLYYFDRAIALDSMYHEAYFRRALVKAKMNTLEGAYEDYSRAISINPEPKYYNNRGINLAIRNRMQEAIEDYDQALALDSTYAQAYLNKGVAQYHLGEEVAACENIYESYQLGLTMAVPYLEQQCGYQITTEP